MNRDYVTKFDNWYKEIDKDDKLILTNDVDSLASCYVLNQLFNVEIKAFYNFDTLYMLDTQDTKRYIGVDLYAISQKARVFSNHVTYFENERVISLNKGISRANYSKKFAGSTLITIMSLYDIDISKFTTEQLEVLICIDTAFKQYFFCAELFKKYYADILEYPVFVDVVQRHDKEYFYKIIRKYKLHEPIHINSVGGYLYTDIDLIGLSELFNINLELPKEQFHRYREFRNMGVDLDKINLKSLDRTKIFSSALVRKNFLKISVA